MITKLLSALEFDGIRTLYLTLCKLKTYQVTVIHLSMALLHSSRQVVSKLLVEQKYITKQLELNDHIDNPV